MSSRRKILEKVEGRKLDGKEEKCKNESKRTQKVIKRGWKTKKIFLEEKQQQRKMWHKKRKWKTTTERKERTKKLLHKFEKLLWREIF